MSHNGNQFPRERIICQNITDEGLAFVEDPGNNQNIFEIISLDKEEPVKTENLEVIIERDDTVDWREDNIKTLLDLYLEHIEEFRNPKCRKKEIWKKISNHLGISIEACDRKFRNLKQHYIHIVTQRMKPGGKARFPPRWPYYQLMDTIFCNDPYIHPNVDHEITTETILSKREQSLIGFPASKRKRFISQNEVKNLRREKVESFHKIADDVSRKQDEMSFKLDKLINTMQESNDIQRRRNELFEKYIEKVMGVKIAKS